MQKILVVLLMCLFTGIELRADLGPPTIQAVCKVTLTNGKSVEGLITLGKGGYYGLWMSGFFFDEGGVYKSRVSFLYDFTSFKKVNDSVYSIRKVTEFGEGTGGRSRVKTMSFFEWAGPNQSIYEPSKTTFERDRSVNYIVETTHIEKRFVLKDTIEIYQELPSTTFLSAKEKAQFVRVKVSEIASFEILSHPSEKWLKEITEKTLKADELYNRPGGSGDFAPAVWYHDLVANTSAMAEIQKSIEYNMIR